MQGGNAQTNRDLCWEKCSTDQDCTAFGFYYSQEAKCNDLPNGDKYSPTSDEEIDGGEICSLDCWTYEMDESLQIDISSIVLNILYYSVLWTDYKVLYCP